MLWSALSRVPGTQPHRLYRGTIAYIGDCEKLLEEDFPGCPKYPSPIPRHPEACRLAVESMQAVLRAISAGEAGASGAEVLAVFNEHAPVAFG